MRPRLALAVVPAAIALALTVPAAPASSVDGLPDRASDVGHEHAHTHGPDGVGVDGRRPGRPVPAQPVDVQLTGSWSTENPLPVRTSDQSDVFTGLPQVHLVYLYPSDLRTPRTGFLNMFEADARAAQAFLQRTYGRSVRFDERADGRLDITVAKSKYRTRDLGGKRQFSLVDSELDRLFPSSDTPRKKYIAWLDAPSKYCGQGELYGDWHRDRENWNDLRTTGVVYRPFDATGVDGGWCRGRTLLHELGHNLGALYDGAPNAFDGAHCDDDKNDVMCYQGNAVFDSSLEPTSSAGEFDWGNDDYWDAGAVAGSLNSDYSQHLNWWTVNLSRFVCRPGTQDGSPRCDDVGTVHPTLEEFRYHSGDEAYPPPDSVPTG